MVRWVSKLQEETEMARRGENIHKRKDGRWEGRYIKARTPEGKIQWGYIYGTAYAEVKRVLIQKKAEAGFYNLKRTDLTFEVLAEVWLHSLRNSIKESTYSRSWFYTKDEIIYKLSQGAHEESERVQTSGTSNPVERTVLNCDKVLASMNREVQTQRTEQFLEPYYEVCEQIELFEIGLRSLRGQTRLVAEQLFVDGKKQTEITGVDGNNLTRRNVVREKENALQGIAAVIRWRKEGA